MHPDGSMVDYQSKDPPGKHSEPTIAVLATIMTSSVSPRPATRQQNSERTLSYPQRSSELIVSAAARSQAGIDAVHVQGG